MKYTADKKNGFQASIITDGHVVHHPQEPVQPIHHNQVPHVVHVSEDGGGEREDDEYIEE